ncbi:MAG: CotH kinase family protein [Bdellovibrionota bacterium]
MNKKRSLFPLALLLLGISFIYGYIASLYRSNFDLNRFSTATAKAKIAPVDLQSIFQNVGESRTKREFYNALTQSAPRPSGKIPNVELYIPEYILQQWKSFREKPKGMAYVNAQIRTWNTDFTFAKVRVRGDHSYHWGNDYPSLRVKMPENQSFMGFQTFNLIHPRSVTGFERFIGLALADEMGLLHENGWVVRVFVNGKYWGFFQFVCELDEKWARRNKALPGDIYSGEKEPFSKPIGEKTYKKPKDVWYSLDYWKKVSYNNSINKTDFSVLQEGMDILYLVDENPNAENRELLEKHFQVDEFLKMFALETYIGSKHFDRHHNWKILHDPSTGKLRPIVWDLWGHGHGGASLETDLYWPLALPQKAMLRFPDLQLKKNQYLYELIQLDQKKQISMLTLQRLEEEVSGEFGQAPKLAKPLWLRADPWTIIATNEEVKRSESDDFVPRIRSFIVERTSALDHVMSEAEIEATYKSKGTGAQVNVMIKSECAFEVVAVTSGGKALTTSHSIIYPNVSVKSHDSGHSRYKATTHQTLTSIDLPSFHDEGVVEISLKNLVTGQVIAVKAKKETQEFEIPSLENVALFNTGYVPHPVTITKTIGPGAISFENNQVFDSWTRVVIEPGTHIELSKDVSILFYGDVHAKGTAEKPITIVRKNKTQAWGSIVFNGGNVKLDHFHAEGGSVHKSRLMNYSGMVSIYNCPIVHISNSGFSKNSVGDDLVNIKNSSGIRIESSEFFDALFDALDIDYGKGEILKSNFHDSGNDLLDFMGSDLDIHHSTFLHSGDKGISVGEGSTLIVTHSQFSEMSLGLAIKDQSVLFFDKNEFHNVELQMDAYQKSKYYGGSLVVVPDLKKVPKRHKDEQSIYTETLEIPSSLTNPERIVPLEVNLQKIKRRMPSAQS